MKRAVATLVLSASLLAGAFPVSAAQAATPVTSSDYSSSKKSQFWTIVTKLRPVLKLAKKSDVIGLGVLTCDLLRSGGDLSDLAELASQAKAGVLRDSITTIFAAAPVVLCRDQQYKFD